MRKFGNNALIGILITAMVIIVSVIATHFINGAGVAFVKGDSMRPSLEDGELIMYAKDETIERFDIVLAHDNHNGDVIVKRVVGLPGEDIAIIEGSLYIDGKEYVESYLHDDIKTYNQEVHRIQLADNEYYVMGDNRDNSTDSRVIGPITKDNVIGTVHRTLRIAGDNDEDRPK